MESLSLSAMADESTLTAAMAHEIDLGYEFASSIEPDLFKSGFHRSVAIEYQRSYTDKAPTLKYLADNFHDSLIGAGWSQADAQAKVERLEQHADRRAPTVDQIQAAIGKLSAKQPDKQKVYTLSYGFAGYDAEFSYLMKRYIPAASLGMVFGASGAYKSFLAIAWACSIATGRPWNGTPVTQAPVLYIVGEGGVGVPKRIFAWCQEYNKGQSPDELCLLNFPIPMADLAHTNNLISTIKAEQKRLGKKFGLVVIDTLARCFGAADENRSDDMNAFVCACDRVKAETGASVLVVHHSGKDAAKGARGSTVMKAACDFEFRVERHNDDHETGLILTCTKAKDDKEPARQLFPLAERFVRKDSDGDDVVSLVCSDTGQTPPEPEPERDPSKALGKNEQIVYQAVRSRMANGESTARKVIIDDLKAQGIAVKHFSRWVNNCVEADVIEDREGLLIAKVASQ
ncbi:helicase RepA family protein [Paraferrimonas sedimenticola]|uniref:AAA family ATPase n=1 Tax=Paraferrimonas sedimenticola TaxID=375674 RepID=A0AA37RUD1_9GAMM|nr:helicase RepA family protein [Paraferrimonas sedimenticola]GLP95346.1 hypothetical protein GCM10007895_06520 [Paraferrimonas sedimenticola]